MYTLRLYGIRGIVSSVEIPILCWHMAILKSSPDWRRWRISEPSGPSRNNIGTASSIGRSLIQVSKIHHDASAVIERDIESGSRRCNSHSRSRKNRRSEVLASKSIWIARIPGVRSIANIFVITFCLCSDEKDGVEWIFVVILTTPMSAVP